MEPLITRKPPVLTEGVLLVLQSYYNTKFIELMCDIDTRNGSTYWMSVKMDFTMLLPPTLIPK